MRPKSPSLVVPPSWAASPDPVLVEAELADAMTAFAADVLFPAGVLAGLPDRLRAEWLAPRAELGRAIAATVMRADDAHSPEELRAMAARRLDELHAFRAPGQRIPRALHEVPQDRLWRVGDALREHMLEGHQAQVVLGSRGRELFVVPERVTDAQAQVWILGALYEKVEAWVAEDFASAMEREAARWWLSRWRAPTTPEADSFASRVREQEFSLVARSGVILGASPLAYMVDDRLLEAAGVRQLRMAQALLQSVPGVWEVESRQGAETVFRDPLDGTRLSVREHALEQRYGARSVAIGRVIPFGDGSWLRSPGTLIIPEQGAKSGLARGLAAAVEKAVETDVYAEGAVEGIISTLFRFRGIPRAVRPNVTPDEAAVLGRDLHSALRAAGAAEEADPAEVPNELNLPGTTVLSLRVDLVLAEYLEALLEHSKKGTLMRQTRRRRERDAQKRKGRP